MWMITHHKPLIAATETCPPPLSWQRWARNSASTWAATEVPIRSKHGSDVSLRLGSRCLDQPGQRSCGFSNWVCFHVWNVKSNGFHMNASWIHDWNLHIHTYEYLNNIDVLAALKFERTPNVARIGNSQKVQNGKDLVWHLWGKHISGEHLTDNSNHNNHQAASELFSKSDWQCCFNLRHKRQKTASEMQSMMFLQAFRFPTDVYIGTLWYNIQMYVHAYIHTYIHTYIHDRHTYIHTYIHYRCTIHRYVTSFIPCIHTLHHIAIHYIKFLYDALYYLAFHYIHGH